MLSGETSVGKFPIVAVETMARIIVKMEENALDTIPPLGGLPRTKGGAITRAAADVGELLGARYLVAFTQSGDSARRLVAAAVADPVAGLHAGAGGAQPARPGAGASRRSSRRYVKHTDEMVRQVDQALLDAGRAARGDLVVIVAGSPPGIPGSTNAMRVHRIGDAAAEVVEGYAE